MRRLLAVLLAVLILSFPAFGTAYGPPTFIVTTTNLSSANILALNATPITIVAAPGSGQTAILNWFDIVYTKATTNYAGGSPVRAQYHSSTTSLLATNLGAIGIFTNNGSAASSSIGNYSANAVNASSNTAIEILATGSAFTTGDGAAVITAYSHNVSF